MDVTMKKMEVNSEYKAYTISVDDCRIFTVVTESTKVAGKWLSEALRVYHRGRSPNSGGRTEAIVVGISVDKPTAEACQKYPNGGDPWYNLYTICIGAQCLVFNPSELSTTNRRLKVAPQLNAFFSDPRVVVVGRKMEEVVKKLDLDHGVKIRSSSTVDVHEVLAATKWELNIKRFDLDKLVKAVLGKRFDVVRPKGNNSRIWFRQNPPFFGEAHVKFSVVDAYFLYLLGNEIVSGFPQGFSIANPSFYLSDKLKNVQKKKLW